MLEGLVKCNVCGGRFFTEQYHMNGKYRRKTCKWCRNTSRKEEREAVKNKEIIKLTLTKW